uniref:Galectin n=1 Tax=Panagrolaimus sp. PS1159 TaxID=55785 RepID=A0AC35FJX4_9BILA
MANIHENKSYTVPYRSQLQERIEPGQTLIVKGSTIEESQRFTINLHHKTPDFAGNDVPLHISVRFDEGKIVFNSFVNGEWGKEERKSNPIKRGESFDIRIRSHDDRYQIFVDQKEFKDFEHRVPLSSVSHFSVDGDLYLQQIHWGGKYYPVPYESDISLHFNPRFSEKHVVRNALQAGEWGNEEREGKMVFEKGVGFDLTIINESYGFQIFVNDERFCTFAHRDDPSDISGLQIQGDVEITGIQIQ